jgi:hypothetical protein
MHLKFVSGYVTKDGKFFESTDRDLAEQHEAELAFIERYKDSGHVLNHTGTEVPSEHIYEWITSMPREVLQQFKTMVSDISYIPTAEDNDE